MAGIVDIEALRQFRVMNLNSNWMKDLRTELFRRMYEQPVHPPNLWLEQDPLQHEAVDEVYRANIERLIERGAFTPPGARLPRLPLPAAQPQPGRRGLGERQAALGGRVTSSCAALGALRHPLAELRDRARPREQVALPEIAADLAQPGVLLGPLDALGHGRHAEAARERHDGGHERAIAAAPGEARR